MLTLTDCPASAANHPFFHKLLSEQLSDNQVRRFAGQWYSAAYNHKRAFPSLVFITDCDETCCELVVILHDEYGKGDPQAVHAVLLKQFLQQALHLSDADIKAISTVPEVAAFGQTTMRIWSGNDPALAFGYHYALEHLAATAHPAFYAMLQKQGYPESSLRYFAYHATAEPEHAAMAETGYQRYLASGGAQQLQAGIDAGVSALTNMWDGFDRHVFN